MLTATQKLTGLGEENFNFIGISVTGNEHVKSFCHRI